MSPLELLLKQIDDKVRRLEEALGVGEAKDFAEYQRICGEIKGLLSARMFVLDLKQNMENSDE
jgi:hypothetical protein